MGWGMKYNDYPLPNDQLISVLSKQYALNSKIKNQQIISVKHIEQEEKLNKLYVYISLQKQSINKLEKQNKNFNIDDKLNDHLQILADMGAKSARVLCGASLNSSMFNYLKCQAEILKILVFLIMLDNLSFNRASLAKILTEQTECFNIIVNCGTDWC